MADRLVIFDTTLRDGEQAPGFSMRSDEKVRLACQLERLGVDIVEAGFPIASDADAEAVRRVSLALERSVVAALARCAPGDIDRAAWATAPARRSRSTRPAAEARARRSSTGTRTRRCRT